MSLITWSHQNIDNCIKNNIHLCVENPLLKINKVVITKKEVEVLEGLCEEERLLNIILVCLNLNIYQSDELIIFDLRV